MRSWTGTRMVPLIAPAVVKKTVHSIPLAEAGLEPSAD